MSSVQKKQRELREGGEFNLSTTRVDDKVLLGGDSVKEILCCHHSKEMSLAGLKIEFSISNSPLASERIHYFENLREEGGYRLPLCLYLCLHWLIEDPQAVWASARVWEVCIQTWIPSFRDRGNVALLPRESVGVFHSKRR